MPGIWGKVMEGVQRIGGSNSCFRHVDEQCFDLTSNVLI